jgi:hypothetical protein
MTRTVYIELPPEDGRKNGKENIGLLQKSMYGLRDAPQIWQSVVRDMLECRGFVSLVGVQCCYANPTSGVLIVAHVDDFLVYGGGAELRNLIKDLQRDFEVNGQILGPDTEAGEVDTIRFWDAQ